jgi:hypothetical protein
MNIAGLFLAYRRLPGVLLAAPRLVVMKSRVSFDNDRIRLIDL